MVNGVIKDEDFILKYFRIMDTIYNTYLELFQGIISYTRFGSNILESSKLNTDDIMMLAPVKRLYKGHLINPPSVMRKIKELISKRTKLTIVEYIDLVADIILSINNELSYITTSKQRVKNGFK